MIRNIKDVLPEGEYIGYLKGTIIAMVADDDIGGLDWWIAELRSALSKLPMADAPALERLTDATMREIRDGMIRVGKNG